jgi:hypothetical protein
LNAKKILGCRQDKERDQEQEVKTTVVEFSCNTEDGVGVNKENADTDVYERVTIS